MVRLGFGTFLSESLQQFFWMDSNPDGRSLLMVTDQVNITALTGIFPRSGELVVLRLGEPGGFEIVGRIDALFGRIDAL